MPDSLPEKEPTTINDLYGSDSNGTPSIWEREASNTESYLAPSGEEINYTRFLNDINDYSKGEVFEISKYMQEKLTLDGLGQRRDLPTSEYSDGDVLSMVDRMSRLNIEEDFGKVGNYALSRPFIISTFNVLRLMPSILFYSRYGQEAETALRIGLDQLTVSTDPELFWRKEMKSKESSLLYKTNEGFQRMQGNNPNPSGKITKAEMAKVVLPNVVRILKKVNHTRTVFK